MVIFPLLSTEAGPFTKIETGNFELDFAVTTNGLSPYFFPENGLILTV
jgi:hypothetical protein